MIKKLTISVYTGLILGILCGCIKALYFIQIENYSKFELQKFGFYFFKYNLDLFVVWMLAASLIFGLIWSFYDSFEGLIISCITVGAVITPIGYFINKNILPGFAETESIIGNSVVLLIAITLVFIIYSIC